MSLKKYLSKRELKKSHEPKARVFKRQKGALQFVVQKHAASHLHYDFRLEVDGVLKSWAVPKGPSLDPTIKHLAIQVEDHPYEYRTFEGIIPSGYGAGTVMIWDHGSYSVDNETNRRSEELIQEGLKKGEIHFTLQGDKLRGRFSLVKLKNKENDWLLIKSKDEFASKEDVTQKDRSVVSDRTLEEIRGKAPPQKKKKRLLSKLILSKKSKEKKPHQMKPMLATLVDKPFDNTDWFFEIKLDGFRAIAELNKKSVEFYSRNFQSFKERFPQVAQDLKKLNLDAILDGEIVALNEKGISRFQLLQNYKQEENIYFYVFDILYLNGKDLRNLPLIERKAILKNVLQSQNGTIRYLDHIETGGKKFFNLCKKHGLEGMIAKQKESLYESGKRSRNWVKIKAEMSQEVVVCGFTEPRKTRKNFGALIVGVYKNGILHFAGHVGGGFTEKELEQIKKKLAPLITKKCPFPKSPRTNTPVTWIRPELLCEVKFKEWTSDGSMRMPIFLGIRTDKPAQTVTKEKKKKVTNIVEEEKDKRSLSKRNLTKKNMESLSTGKDVIQSQNEFRNFITHSDKIYWEKEQITKGDLLHYYESIAPYILPYLTDHPESLKRFPNGSSQASFFQKNITHAPEWLSTHLIKHHEKNVNYALIQDVRSLLYVVNLGCIEIHPWFSRIQDLEYPDFLIFDLDPEDISFDAVVKTAQTLHSVLESIDVPSYCKTSGARGLHICVPLEAQYTFEQAKRFAELIALLVHQMLPESTSLERSPKKRQKRVYIDCYQNNFGQTVIAPYSVRAKPGAPVSTPLEWKEVKRGLNPASYTMFNTLARLKKKGDLFIPVLEKGSDLEQALKKLNL